MKAQRSSLNTINTLPQTIIESILCLLPIEEAARTSVLSREWRYKWTTIPKLVFLWSTLSKRTIEENQPFVMNDIISARKNMDRRCKLFYVIYQVLLLRQGPIHEFTLYLGGTDGHCFEIDQILLHLARNHKVEKLKLHLGCSYRYMYKLPLCVFSLHQLTDLHLCCIDFNYQPMFCGFGSLRSLCLSYVNISTKDLLRLLSNCPSLKSFNLLTEPWRRGFKDCTLIELLKCLPVIEHLTIWGRDLSWLALHSVTEELPTSLIHFKYVCLKEMCFDDDQQLLTFLAILIKCSPNLEKIKLELNPIDEIESGTCSETDETERGTCSEVDETEHETCSEIDKTEHGTCSEVDETEHETCSEIDKTEDGTCSEIYETECGACAGILKEFSDVWLEHLNELEIEYFNNWKSEMEFVKSILARSPKLRKVRISINSEVGKDETLEMLKILLQAPRVSPVEIIVQ